MPPPHRFASVASHSSLSPPLTHRPQSLRPHRSLAPTARQQPPFCSLSPHYHRFQSLSQPPSHGSLSPPPPSLPIFVPTPDCLTPTLPAIAPCHRTRHHQNPLHPLNCHAAGTALGSWIGSKAPHPSPHGSLSLPPPLCCTGGTTMGGL